MNIGLARFKIHVSFVLSEDFEYGFVSLHNQKYCQ